MPLWFTLFFQDFPSNAYSYSRRLHPTSTDWCRGLKGCWEVNSMQSIWADFMWQQMLFVAAVHQVSLDLSWWMHPFLGSTEIANGLCLGYKKDAPGQAVFFFTVFMTRERPWRGSGVGTHGFVCIQNAFDHNTFSLPFPWKALGRGHSPKEVVLNLESLWGKESSFILSGVTNCRSLWTPCSSVAHQICAWLMWLSIPRLTGRCWGSETG